MTSAFTYSGGFARSRQPSFPSVRYENLAPGCAASLSLVAALAPSVLAEQTLGGTGSLWLRVKDAGQSMAAGSCIVTMPVGGQTLVARSFSIGGSTPATQEPPSQRPPAAPRVVTITEPTDNATVSDAVTVRGTAPPMAKVRVKAQSWLTLVIRGWADYGEVEVTAGENGNQIAHRRDLMIPLLGKAPKYRITAELLDRRKRSSSRTITVHP